MPTTFAPVPYQDPIGQPSKKDRDAGRGAPVFLDDAWINWFTTLTQTVQSSPSRVATVGLADQSATVSSTSISVPSFSSGLYRVSWFARISVASGGTSSLTVAFGWSDGGVALAYPGTALTGNTTATYETGILPLINVDSSSPITYSATYASTGTPAMEYELSISVEAVTA